MAAQVSISREDEWFLGEDKVLRFTVWQDPVYTTPEDITGWEFAFEFVEAGASAFVLTTLSGEITLTDAANGVVSVAVAGALTENLDANKPHHFLLKRTNVGSIGYLSYGDVVLLNPLEV